MTNQPHICAQCGIEVPESELYTFDGHSLCLHCLEENTVFCREYGERIYDVAINLSDEELRSLTWNTFVSGITEDCRPKLVRYLKERRFYAN